MIALSTLTMKRAPIIITLLVVGLAALLTPSLAGASAPSWHTYRIKPAHDLATVRCPSNSLCVAITHTGQVLTTRNASAAKPKWRLTAGLRVFGPEEDFEQRTAFNLACPSTHLCVTSYRGEIISTTQPTGPASGWHAVDIQPSGLNADPRLDSVTCPKTTLCVAGMNEWANQEGTSRHPARPSRRSLHTFSAHADRLNAISCRSSSFCVAVGDRGLVAVLRRGG